MDGYRRLNGGDRVLFDVDETPLGPEAKNIRKVEQDNTSLH